MENNRLWPSYEGDKNERGEFHGQGIYYYADGGRHEGEYKGGKRNGPGIFYYAGDDRFEGEYKDGKRNGPGIYYHADGARFEGEYKDDRANGPGIFYTADGNRHEGEYKDGKRNGPGIYYYLADNQWKGDRFEGEYKDGKRNGPGINYFANGTRFEGEYKDGKRNGPGIYYFANGTRLEGEWYGSELIVERVLKPLEKPTGRVNLEIVPWAVDYYEQFGDNLVQSSKSNPVSFTRLHNRFEEQICEALIKTEAIPSRHKELLAVKDRVDSLLGISSPQSPREGDWV